MPPTRKPAGLPTPLATALEAQLAGAAPTDALEAIDDLPAAVAALFTAIAKATKAQTWPLHDALLAVAARLPALAVIEAGLAKPAELSGPAAAAIGAAIVRAPDLATIRDRLLAIWLGPPAAKSPDRVWDQLAFHVLRPACRDAGVVDALGADLLAANLADTVLGRRHVQTIWALRDVPDGRRHVVRRRRHERARTTPQLTGVLLDSLGEPRTADLVPTLLLELARRRDRDSLLRALARIDDPRVLPILERALATDQYTRVVAEGLLSVRGLRAEALLAGLVDHTDPLVRIRAAHGLIGRRGAAAAPLLLAALAHARAAGIWPAPDGSVGTWFNEQLGRPDDALERPPFDLRPAWPAELRAGVALPDPGPVEPSSAPARMISANPDVRRDAIELAHVAALAARDRSAILMLVRGHRLHDALCARAGLAQTTSHGSCARVNLGGHWSSWRKLAQLPFDPAYKYTSVTLDWLEAHAPQLAPQVVPPELADVVGEAGAAAVAAAQPERRLRFSAEEVAGWDAEELAWLG